MEAPEKTRRIEIQVHDKSFVPFISEEEIAARVHEISHQMNQDLAGKNPIFLAILNGAFMFAADVFKKLDIPAEIVFIRLASYWGTKSTGNVVTLLGLDQDVSGRTVVILEDIIDTGKTLAEFLPKLQERGPAEVKIATLLIKPNALQHDIPVAYQGFEIPSKFVVGYGLDYDGLGRNLSDIYKVKE